MGLLDFPPELLDLIIDNTTPSGLENFALSCKTVYGRAKAQIAHHNHLKRKWGLTTNALPARRGDTLHILHQLSREPRAAEYIESLRLWDRRTQNDLPQDKNSPDFRHDGSALAKIRSLLGRAEFFANADPDEWWDQILQEDAADDEDGVDKLYATVALLALLPNLKSLQLPDGWHEVKKGEAAEALVPAVEKLVALSNESRRYSRPLQSLETLYPFVEEGYDIRVALQCLQPFMCLESIRNLYAVSCVAVEGNWDTVQFEWPNQSLQSPLTRVELASCCMDSHGLSVLLENAPCITIFKYSHQTKWDGLEFDWNPGAFLETLANYCGDRLTELAITVDELHGEIINGASSLMRFPRLEKLEMDVSPFCGPPVESGQRLGQDARMPEGAKPWAHVDIPCMGDMLPISIRELHINTDHPQPSEQALKSLFKNIKARSADKLIFLKKVVIRQYIISTAQQVADDHGIILEVFDGDVASPRPRAMMPLWKREFDEKVGGIVMTTGHYEGFDSSM